MPRASIEVAVRSGPARLHHYQFLELLDQEDLLCPLNGILGDRPGFPHLLARIGSVVPALWTAWLGRPDFQAYQGAPPLLSSHV